MHLRYIYLFLFHICGIYCITEVVVTEDNSLELKCNDPNTGLYIDEASWSYNMGDARNWVMPKAGFRNLMFIWGKLVNSCVYDAQAAVKGLCHGKKSCTIKADRQTFSDACVYWMELKVSYECLPCNHRVKRTLGDVLNVDYICDFREMLPSRYSSTGCPNNRFEAKHICKTCRNDEIGAALFALRVDATMRNSGHTTVTDVQSVFIVEDGLMTYTEGDPYCVFNLEAPKYNCYPDAQTGWSCTYLGLKIAYHEKYTGHYEPSLDNQVFG